MKGLRDRSKALVWQWAKEVEPEMGELGRRDAVLRVWQGSHMIHWDQGDMHGGSRGR